MLPHPAAVLIFKNLVEVNNVKNAPAPLGQPRPFLLSSGESCTLPLSIPTGLVSNTVLAPSGLKSVRAADPEVLLSFPPVLLSMMLMLLLLSPAPPHAAGNTSACSAWVRRRIHAPRLCACYACCPDLTYPVVAHLWAGQFQSTPTTSLPCRPGLSMDLSRRMDVSSQLMRSRAWTVEGHSGGSVEGPKPPLL